jgi:hypothetical protein
MAKKDSILKRTGKKLDEWTDNPIFGLLNPEGYVSKQAFDYIRDLRRDRDSSFGDRFSNWRDRDRSFGDRFSNWRDRRTIRDFEGRGADDDIDIIDPYYTSPSGEDDRSLGERFADWRDRNKARRKERQQDRTKGISDDARYAMRDRNTMLSNFAAQKGFKGSRGDEEREQNIREAKAAHRRVTYNIGGQMKKLKYAEGGEMEDQMNALAISVAPARVEEQETHTMPDGTVMPGATHEEYEQMLPDEKMEEDYVDYVVSSTLSEEDKNYLESALAEDTKLSELFDQVVESASEFSGSGPVEGLGTEVSDSIPARLSDGEFVFTAKATDEIGADNLQQMMEDAEAGADRRQGVAYGGKIDEDKKADIAVSTQGSILAAAGVPPVVPLDPIREDQILSMQSSSPRRGYQTISG